MDRRNALRLGGGALVGVLLGGCGGAEPEQPVEADPSAEVTPESALNRLKYGNGRFAEGNATHPRQGSERRKELDTGQHPFAAILSCVDSRVPPELVFDAGLGDLFVIRSAGQVLDQAVLGSVQYGVHELHVPLVLVLGHRCDARRLG